MKSNALKSAVVAVLTVVSILPVLASAEPAGQKEPQATFEEIKQTLGAVPAMFKQLPDEGVRPFWEQMKTIQLNPKTALSGKSKELIGLGVAAQIPCRYCVYAHTEFAKLNGATSRHLKEAIATAGLAREMSALANGQSPDKASTVEASPALASTYQEIAEAFGSVPSFLQRYPAYALMPLWAQVKAVQLNANGAVSVKEKALISLAIASQLPSAECVKGYTAMARANGASEQEIQEAIAIAGFTRSASTLLNGSMPDESAWRRDVDAVVRHVSQPAPGKKVSSAR